MCLCDFIQHLVMEGVEIFMPKVQVDIRKLIIIDNNN